MEHTPAGSYSQLYNNIVQYVATITTITTTSTSVGEFTFSLINDFIFTAIRLATLCPSLCSILSIQILLFFFCFRFSVLHFICSAFCHEYLINCSLLAPKTSSCQCLSPLALHTVTQQHIHSLTSWVDCFVLLRSVGILMTQSRS